MTEIRESIAGFTKIEAADFDSRATVTITPFGEAEAKQAAIQNVAANTIINAFIKGSTTNFTTTSSYQPIPMFTSEAAADFYTTATGNITKAADNTGITVNIPVRYSVVITSSLEAGLNEDYFFTILVNGVAVDLAQPIMRAGGGAGKFGAFAVDGYTDVLSPGDTIQLGAKNNGDTLDTINASINIKFAGLT